MRKLFILGAICSFILCGCSATAGTESIQIYARSGLEVDKTHIIIDSKYTLKDYDKETTDTGCVVTIYYELYDER